MTREVVNEASAFTVRTTFEGINKVLTTPSSARYRIYDVSNERVVRDWTVLTAAQVVDIEITADDNRIYRDGQRPFKRFEERVITVQANYDTETQFTQEERYLIKNLRGFDS